MSEADIAARLIDALTKAAAEAAGATAPPISVSIEFVGVGEAADLKTRVERKTRTLVFMAGEAFNADGARIASATAVHKIPDAAA
ncbi:MAG: hypothetical protein ABUL55_02220 [Pseudomonadota bacterium]